jgi:hypothetical protein
MPLYTITAQAGALDGAAKADLAHRLTELPNPSAPRPCNLALHAVFSR